GMTAADGGSPQVRSRPRPEGRRRAAVLGTLSAVILLLIPSLARSAWTQDKFLVGGYCVNGTGVDYRTELSAMNSLGLDFVINFNHASPTEAHTLYTDLVAMRGQDTTFKLRLLVDHHIDNNPATIDYTPRQWIDSDANWAQMQNSMAYYAGSAVLGFHLQDEPDTSSLVNAIRRAVDRVVSTTSVLGFVNLLGWKSDKVSTETGLSPPLAY